MEIAVNAIVGALILLALGWLKSDVNGVRQELHRLTEAVGSLAERVSRIEGRLDEREHRS